MERSWLGLMITAAGLQFFTILALICGLWPGDCHSIKRSTLYLIAAIMSLLACKKPRLFEETRLSVLLHIRVF